MAEMVNAIFFTFREALGINEMMRACAWVLFFLGSLSVSGAGLEPTAAIWAERKGKSDYRPKPGERLFICQPNGWGSTPKQAVRDLNTRVMRIYEREPGFVRHDYVAIIPISKSTFQADGRCTYFVRRALTHRGTVPANAFLQKDR
jgi:hypothetical protein